jgi:hypothetical protein
MFKREHIMPGVSLKELIDFDHGARVGAVAGSAPVCSATAENNGGVVGCGGGSEGVFYVHLHAKLLHLSYKKIQASATTTVRS